MKRLYDGLERPRATSNSPTGALALPDANSLALHGELTSEVGEVLAVVGDEKLLGALTDVSAIAGAVATSNANLDSTLAH